MPNMWGTTAGGAKNDENSLDGALRELKEELGIQASKEEMIFIGYESFMPIISSMITQYYKYLLQAQKENITLPALTYILTSTCWENTYSHQNPGFVSTLFEKNNSNFYNILYPKNGSDFHDYHTDDIGVCIDDKSFDNILKKLNLVRKI